MARKNVLFATHQRFRGMQSRTRAISQVVCELHFFSAKWCFLHTVNVLSSTLFLHAHTLQIISKLKFIFRNRYSHGPNMKYPINGYKWYQISLCIPYIQHSENRSQVQPQRTRSSETLRHWTAAPKCWLTFHRSKAIWMTFTLKYGGVPIPEMDGFDRKIPFKRMILGYPHL